MNNPLSYEQRVRRAIRKWIYKEIKPDVYAVCTVHQGLWRKTPKGSHYEVGDKILYEKVCSTFRHRLSKIVYGNRYDKSKKSSNGPKLIPMSGTLEGNGKSEHYHINLFVKRPEWLSDPFFHYLFLECWYSLEWAHTHPKYAVEYKAREADCVGYGLKQGSETLLTF
jgi:hypothetical protein